MGIIKPLDETIPMKLVLTRHLQSAHRRLHLLQTNHTHTITITIEIKIDSLGRQQLIDRGRCCGSRARRDLVIREGSQQHNRLDVDFDSMRGGESDVIADEGVVGTVEGVVGGREEMVCESLDDFGNAEVWEEKELVFEEG